MSYIVPDFTSVVTVPRTRTVFHLNRKKQYTATIVCNKRTAEDAFRLRYASYFDGGFIDENPKGSFSDEFDELANATTVVVYENDVPVGSVRVCFLSRAVRQAPAHRAFPGEIDAILAEVARSEQAFDVVEITRLVRSPACIDNQGLVFLLYKLAGYLGLSRDVQAVVSSVRACHMPFYRRLGFQVVSGPMPYPGLNCPMHLLQCGRSRYDQARAAFALMDPDASPPGTFDGFLSGRTIATPMLARD